MVRFDFYSNRVEVDKDGAFEPETPTRPNPFAEELKNLVGAINGTEELRLTPQWGRHIVAVLEVCEESSRSGREMQVR